MNSDLDNKKKPDFFFKIKKTSKTGKKFLNIQNEMIRCYKKAQDLVIELGGESWNHGHFNVSGGISAIKFRPKFKSSNYKVIKIEDDVLHFPKSQTKGGREILKKIEELPVVQIRDLNEIMNIKELLSNIGFKDRGDYFLVDCPGNWVFTPPTDAKKITEQQHKELLNV